MLKTIKSSSNKKLGACASTYRAGNQDVFGTCANNCQFKPETSTGASALDMDYLRAVKEAVPERGVSWTYTHFGATEEIRTEPGQTCINVSTEEASVAARHFHEGFPVVLVEESSSDSKVTEYMHETGNIRVVRCPAEYSDITCFTCGGDTPLCARSDRDFVIKFTAHGTQKSKINQRLIGLTEFKGGCYGASGPVRLQWEKTKNQTETQTSDAQTLRNFVASLPPGTKLRHHVVGDLGRIE